MALALFATACDIPTAAPEWETRWIIPGEETTVEVAELLPVDVTLAAGGTAFAVQVDPVFFSETLGNLCPACIDGPIPAKPPFQGTFEDAATLPAEVSSATVSQGTITVALFNGFSFDPVQPGGATTGTITITLYDGAAGGTVLDQVVIDGATEAFAPGSTVFRTLDVAGSTIGSTLTVLADVDSPLGGAVTINTAETVQITATPSEIQVSSATIDVSGETVSLGSTDLDVDDIGEDTVDRIQSGAFVFEIQNPFGIAVAFTTTISNDPPTFPAIVKTMDLTGAAVDTVRVEFTQNELTAFLGQAGVTLTGDGVVSGSAGEITVTPDQVIVIDSELDIVLTFGGEG